MGACLCSLSPFPLLILYTRCISSQELNPVDKSPPLVRAVIMKGSKPDTGSFSSRILLSVNCKMKIGWFNKVLSHCNSVSHNRLVQMPQIDIESQNHSIDLVRKELHHAGLFGLVNRFSLDEKLEHKS